jgi:F-type H+-transporting ATPase subunit delta
MSELTVRRRYANALIDEAARQDCTQAVDDDVDMLRATLDETHEFVRLVESPAIPQDKKRDAFEALLEDRVHPITLRFVKLLVEKDRETLLADLLDTYQHLRDQQEGIVEVQARVPAPLDDAERDKFVQRLQAMTGKDIRLNVTVHPDLIGGLVFRIGDRVYDGSVRQKLDNLRDSWGQAAHTAANGQPG